VQAFPHDIRQVAERQDVVGLIERQAVAMVACLFALVWSLRLGGLAIAGIVAVVALLVYEHSLVKPPRSLARQRAFFTMNGYSACYSWSSGRAIFSSMQVQFDDPRLIRFAIRWKPAKPLFRRRLALYQTKRPSWRSATGELSCGNALTGIALISTSNRHIQSHRGLRGQAAGCAPSASALRDPQGVYDVAGRGLAQGGRGLERGQLTDFHINVGGLHPELTLDWFCEMLRGLKQRFPDVPPEGLYDGGDRVPRQADEDFSIRETLVRLRDAGMDSLSRRWREIFHGTRPAASSAITKSMGRSGSRPRARAHQLGLRSNCTMLYATWRTTRTAWIIWSGCASCRTETGGFVNLNPAGVPSREPRR